MLHTETDAPYDFGLRNVTAGNYILTVKATDNSGLVTTSAAVHISVVPNKPPIVNIPAPKNNQAFAAPADILIEAGAEDPDGRMARVEFYNGSTLLNTQYQVPYRFMWKDVPTGAYTITAVATDNWGAKTTSVPVKVKVTSTAIVTSRPAVNYKTSVSEAVNIEAWPNPATNVVNITITGLKESKPINLLTISTSGVIMKTLQSSSSNKTIQLDVSKLARGVYTVKVLSGSNVLYKKFVKL